MQALSNFKIIQPNISMRFCNLVRLTSKKCICFKQYIKLSVGISTNSKWFVSENQVCLPWKHINRMASRFVPSLCADTTEQTNEQKVQESAALTIKYAMSGGEQQHQQMPPFVQISLSLSPSKSETKIVYYL